MKRTQQKQWLQQEDPLGWEEFLPLDEVKARYVDGDGALNIQVTIQLLQ